MKHPVERAQELIRSMKDHPDPVAEMKAIEMDAPPSVRPFVSRLWEAFWVAHQQMSQSERPTHDHD